MELFVGKGCVLCAIPPVAEGGSQYCIYKKFGADDRPKMPQRRV